MISYTNKKGEKHVGVFSEEEDLNIQIKCLVFSWDGFLFLKSENRILSVTKDNNQNTQIIIFDKKSISEEIITIEEIQILFEYPQILFVKGTILK